jgi:hypothetical protein
MNHTKFLINSFWRDYFEEKCGLSFILGTHMRSITNTFFICWLFFLSGQCYGAEIDRIDFRLYLSYSGILSDPIEEHAELLNVIIGGGISGPSSSTLVDVIVSSDPGSYKKNAIVSFVVTNQLTGKVLSRQFNVLGVFSSEGKFHAAFWLPETGCTPLRLVATLRGTSKSKAVSLPFECGE